MLPAAEASSRPWRLIQMLCQPSIATAVKRIAALNNSWPMPLTAAAIAPAPTATREAPSPPPATPPVTQIPRRGTPRHAASTMPTTSDASRTSRKTMIAVANMSALLFDDQVAAGLRVKIVEELIAARIERADEHCYFLTGSHNLFAVKLVALKFRGGRVLVAHNQLDLDPRGDLNLAWHELVVLQRDRETGIVSEGGGHGG